MKKEIVCMFVATLFLMCFISAYPITLNPCKGIGLNNNLSLSSGNNQSGNQTLNGNVSLNCSGSFIQEIDNINFSQATRLEVYLYNNTLYFVQFNQSHILNLSGYDFSYFVNEDEFQVYQTNLQSLTLSDYAKKSDFENFTNSSNQGLNQTIADLQTNLDNNKLSTLWKGIIIVNIIASCILLILVIKVMSG